MPRITVIGDNAKSFEVPSGTKLVLALEDNGVPMLHRCGGQARCTTCRVEIVEGTPPPMGEKERTALMKEPGLIERYRLSCQIRVESDLTVRIPPRPPHLEGVSPGPRPRP
jgi:ferredoxin